VGVPVRVFGPKPRKFQRAGMTPVLKTADRAWCAGRRLPHLLKVLGRDSTWPTSNCSDFLPGERRKLGARWRGGLLAGFLVRKRARSFGDQGFSALFAESRRNFLVSAEDNPSLLRGALPEERGRGPPEIFAGGLSRRSHCVEQSGVLPKFLGRLEADVRVHGSALRSHGGNDLTVPLSSRPGMDEGVACEKERKPVR